LANPPDDLRAADFDRGSEADFEQRFLDYAYATKEQITAVSVAHALRLPIALCSARLEELAAADAIHREVDDRGAVYYQLPGTGPTAALATVQQQALDARAAPRGTLVGSNYPPPTEAVALTGLALNLCVPGVGSLVAGRTALGLMQLSLLIVGIPLCFVLIGLPVVLAAWVWGLVSGITALREAQQAAGRDS
jgi:TM2 domain-containing membrane protein YozV